MMASGISGYTLQIEDVKVASQTKQPQTALVNNGMLKVTKHA